MYWQSWVVDHLQRVGTLRIAAVLVSATTIGIAFVWSHRASNEDPTDDAIGATTGASLSQELNDH